MLLKIFGEGPWQGAHEFLCAEKNLKKHNNGGKKREYKAVRMETPGEAARKSY